MHFICVCFLALVLSLQTFSSQSADAHQEAFLLTRQLSQLSNNMFRYQIMLAKYSVDWGGEYPASASAFFAELAKSDYAEQLSNPFNQRSQASETLMNYADYKPDLKFAGRILYEPLMDKQKHITAYRLYAVNHLGKLLSKRGEISELVSEAESKYQPTGLHAAAQQGNIKAFAKLTAAQLNPLDRYGMTPLMWATASDQAAMVDYLVQQGGRFSPANHAGISEIYLATLSKSETWFQQALQRSKPADFAFVDAYGETALVKAVYMSQPSRVQALLAKQAPGADIALDLAYGEYYQLKTEPSMFELILPYASISGIQKVFVTSASAGDLVMLERMFAKGAEVNQLDFSDEFALGMAAYTGKLQIVKWLLDHGAEPNFLEPATANSALIMATSSSEYEIVAYLLSHGAKLDLQNAQGETALMLAVDYDAKDIFEILLKSGADSELRDQAGQSTQDRVRTKAELLGDSEFLKALNNYLRIP